MDANGQRFWLALGGTPWVPDAPGTLALHDDRLQLASQAGGDPFVETVAAAEAALARVPMTRDGCGTWAFVDPDGVTVRATGAFSEPEPVAASPAPTDSSTSSPGGACGSRSESVV